MAFMLRALAKPLSAAATAVGMAAGAIGFNQATNSCSDSISQAYRKFMPAMDYPDLSKHNNCLKNVLTPQLYAKLRDLVSFHSSIVSLLLIILSLASK